MTGKSETVTAGRDTIGTIISNDRGHEAFSARTGYVATFPTLHAARKKLFELHKVGQ